MNIFTVGYAGFTQDAFTELLKKHGVQAIADVRSSPFSKMFPQYNRTAMPEWLRQAGIRYAYLGEELGPRSKDDTHYLNGQVQFDILHKTEAFQKGIRRLEDGGSKMKVAIMCAENDPATCHRSLLVAHYTQKGEMEFSHILKNGNVETHHEMLTRAMKKYGIAPDMFNNLDDCHIQAHARLCKEHAYKKTITRANENGVAP